MIKSERIRTIMTMEDVRKVLVDNALEFKRIPRRLRQALKRFMDKPVKVIEIHNRHHQVYVNRRTTKGAVKGHLCQCQYATATVNTVAGVFAAGIMRRIAYTLELTENGEFGIYKFGTPDQARQRAIEFDKGRGMIEHVMNFHPLSKTRRADACRAAVRKVREKHGSKPRTSRPLPAYAWLRTSTPADFAA